MRKLINTVLEKKRAYQKTRRLKYYFKGGKIPWSLGYNDYKWEEITKVLGNKKILEDLKTNRTIENFGIGIDERIVEIPWTFSKLSKKSGRLLDAGSSLNHDIVVEKDLFHDKDFTIYTYFPEPINFNQKRISYVYGDLRELPFKESYYDEIVSISTLEHIDMDNSIYGYDIPNNGNDVIKSYEYIKVIQEFVRVLKTKGTLLITVPYGKFENHGFFQQFDKEMVEKIEEILKEFGQSSYYYFQYNINGWKTSTSIECDCAESYNPHTGIGKGVDGASHSRAICCIEFTKKG